MAQVPITINSNGLNPSKSPVSKGDSVHFQLGTGVTGAVVTFDEASVNKVEFLVGSNPLSVDSQQGAQVRVKDAAEGAIIFTAEPTVEQGARKVPWEEGEAVNGELDVTTESGGFEKGKEKEKK